MDLKTLYAPVKNDLADVEGNFKSLADFWKKDFPDLHDMLKHILVGGKILRPALTFMSGRCIDGKTDRILKMATANELMHIATLVHDDAIDRADTRRGRVTVNKLWGTEKAILLGDFLFARAGEFAASTDNLRVTKLFSQTLGIIAVGELRQARDIFSASQNMEGYLQRIAGKTAALLKMSSESGAILAGGTEEQIQTLANYGYNLGLAFQIVDDILDFIGTEKELGKPVGSDLRQGTVTLPALLLMQRQPNSNPVSRFLAGKDREENIARAIEQIKSSGIIEESYREAEKYSEKAINLLEGLPESTCKEALKALASYLVRRRN
ncbi:heptaprenyl diphosphate synthase/octaprenyl-diphosphate synthase [Dehalogenimonas formicexedens]|uniref:Heptaprenyl diphosphate synthase/octaprenyl-diphosphate synthase n=1 Tax=Dehalogenimonas formicexedens TaxID=1839801 RepID=A0A1P8F9S7_9CHLR|nr:polyprenyl synthetase family protein [Dehalogenimonas formicexedens]APV45219.1 heptaprenyl diphosphate synthase/octaprenyl-diphosphate synthase [Dehalogenimonas formicexedens]